MPVCGVGNGVNAGVGIGINHVSERLERRQQESRPLVTELGAWMRAERAKLSRSSPVAEPIDYMLKRLRVKFRRDKPSLPGARESA
jgi:hypothetical protein